MKKDQKNFLHIVLKNLNELLEKTINDENVYFDEKLKIEKKHISLENLQKDPDYIKKIILYKYNSGKKDGLLAIRDIINSIINI